MKKKQKKKKKKKKKEKKKKKKKKKKNNNNNHNNNNNKICFVHSLHKNLACRVSHFVVNLSKQCENHGSVLLKLRGSNLSESGKHTPTVPRRAVPGATVQRCNRSSQTISSKRPGEVLYP